VKIICTTVVRAAKQGDIHGGLYVIDTNNGDILHHAPYERDFVNDNERGGERGLRGICVLPDRIIVADSAGFIELDKDTYEIRRTFQDREYFKSIHEIAFFDDHIWATSTAYDAIVKLDLDFNIKGFWEILGENVDNHKVLTGKMEINPETKSQNDSYHINSIFATKDRLLFSGLLTPLYDFNTFEEVCQIPTVQTTSGQLANGFVHNFYGYDDFFTINFTTFSSLGLSYDGKDFEHFGIPRASDVKYQVDEIASNNWNRGLAMGGGKLFIGSSPARILIFDIETKTFETEIKLEKDMRHAIHGLEIIE